MREVRTSFSFIAQDPGIIFSMKVALSKTQKSSLIVAILGLILYGAGYLWARMYGQQHADANIGAGLLGVTGLALGAVSLFVFIAATLFKKH